MSTAEPELGIGADFALGECGAVAVTTVHEGGPAGLAGLQIGDVVLEMDDGVPEQVLAEYCNGTRPREQGRPVKMRVSRGAEELTVAPLWTPKANSARDSELEALVLASLNAPERTIEPSEINPANLPDLAGLPHPEPQSAVKNEISIAPDTSQDSNAVEPASETSYVGPYPWATPEARQYPPNCPNEDRAWFAWRRGQDPQRSAVPAGYDPLDFPRF